MNDKMRASIYEDVMIDDHYSGFGAKYDQWGQAYRSEKYRKLKALYDAGINAITCEGQLMFISFTPSNNIQTMGGTPDSITVMAAREYDECQ